MYIPVVRLHSGLFFNVEQLDTLPETPQKHKTWCRGFPGDRRLQIVSTPLPNNHFDRDTASTQSSLVNSNQKFESSPLYFSYKLVVADRDRIEATVSRSNTSDLKKYLIFSLKPFISDAHPFTCQKMPFRIDPFFSYKAIYTKIR